MVNTDRRVISKHSALVSVKLSSADTASPSASGALRQDRRLRLSRTVSLLPGSPRGIPSPLSFTCAAARLPGCQAAREPTPHPLQSKAPGGHGGVPAKLDATNFHEINILRIHRTLADTKSQDPFPAFPLHSQMKHLLRPQIPWPRNSETHAATYLDLFSFSDGQVGVLKQWACYHRNWGAAMGDGSWGCYSSHLVTMKVMPQNQSQQDIRTEGRRPSP